MVDDNIMTRKKITKRVNIPGTMSVFKCSEKDGCGETFFTSSDFKWQRPKCPNCGEPKQIEKHGKREVMTIDWSS
jgi:homoaconitase/3-isopropylmalate dehydratase large subunit